MWDSVAQVPLVVALIGVISALSVSLLSKRHQREHQQREAMMKPSEEYARKTIEALAALRYITPPARSDQSRIMHRNEPLLADREERAERLERCEKAIDAVRAVRAPIRLVFHPESKVSDSAVYVLRGLRFCLETAVEFYERADSAEDSPKWREDEGSKLREKYLDLRTATYKDLDMFINDIASRMRRPLRKHSRFHRGERAATTDTSSSLF